MRSISYARRPDMDVIESKYAARLAEAARMPLALLGTFCLQTGSPLEIGIGRSPAGQEYDQAQQTQLILKVISDHYHAHSPFRQEQGTDLAIPAASESAVFWIETGDTLVAVRHLTSTRILFSAIIQSATQRVFQKWQRDMLRLVIDRICARTLSAAGESSAAAAQVLTAVLDTLTVGIAIVEQSERCTYLNTAARTFVEEARLARIFHDRLVWRGVCMDRRYRDAIRTATADTQRSASAFVLPPDEDRDNMTGTLTVSPILATPGTALVTLPGPRRQTELLDSILNDAGLTHAERRLAQLVISGQSVENAAGMLNLKVNTARSYLRKIFEKTGTSRQAELVARYAAHVPPVAWSKRPGGRK